MTTLLVPTSELVQSEELTIDEIEQAAIRAQTEGREADLRMLVEYLQARLAVGWRLSPSAMAAYLTTGVFRRWRYIEFLSRKFVQAATGVSTRQIWNLPSRYGKTWMAQWGCIWVLDATDGKARLLLVSWGDHLSRAKSIEMRDIVRAHGDRLRFTLKADRDTQDQWNTDTGGGLVATGIDGGIYGFGAGGGAYNAELDKMVHGGILVDDPFRNWIEATRAARREHVHTQFKGGIRNRLDEEEAWIIAIHHRLHPEDLTGKLKADMDAGTGEDWEIISLPALAYDPPDPEHPDPLGRAPGEPLEPERFSLEAVRARAVGMTPHVAAAQEQQRPQRHAGTELLREWFVVAQPEEMPAVPSRAVASWDLKLKDKEAGDYVVGQVWWAIGAARWCVDQIRGQYDHPTTEVAIALLQVRHPEVKTSYVESAGSADEVLPPLRRPRPDYEVPESIAAKLGMSDDEVAKVNRLMRGGMGNVKAEPVTQAAKPVRARLYIAPPASQGNVRVPGDAGWVPHWLDEMADFPNGLHDDIVDAASQALKVLAPKPSGGGGGATVTGTIPR